MTDLRAFLTIAARHLQQPMSTTESEFSTPGGQSRRRSWCSWTTFDRLQADAGYWTEELPLDEELGEEYVADGGTWGQPFRYGDIAHIIIPKHFIEEPWEPGCFRQWTHVQDIDGLGARLDEAGIPHNLSACALDVKLF